MLTSHPAVSACLPHWPPIVPSHHLQSLATYNVDPSQPSPIASTSQFDFEHPLLGSRLVYSIHASGGTNYDDTHIDVVSNGLRRSTSSATELLGGASPRSGSPRRRLSGMASPRRRLASPRRWASVDAGQGAGEQAANGSAFAAVAGADGAQEDVASALAAALAGVSEGGSSAAGSASSSSAPARAAPGRLAARTSLLKDALLQQLSSFRLEGDLSSSLGSATVVHGSLPGASRLRTSSGAGSSGAQLYWASDGGGTGDATSGPGSGVDA